MSSAERPTVPGVERGCGHRHYGECAAEQEFAVYRFECPITERDGLSVGDKVLLNGRWPAEIIGFNSLPDDVAVRWTGLRPLAALGGDSTIDRRRVTVERVLANGEPGSAG